MTDIDYQEIIRQLDKSDKEREESYQKIKKSEEEALKNILKHFDRIHDKLFAFNNILIVGFFTLSKLDNSISVKNILIPICNLIFLIYIEYRMMEKNRYESQITERTFDEIKKHGKVISKINWYSLYSIATTFIVTIFFLYYLIY